MKKGRARVFFFKCLEAFFLPWSPFSEKDQRETENISKGEIGKNLAEEILSSHANFISFLKRKDEAVIFLKAEKHKRYHKRYNEAGISSGAGEIFVLRLLIAF